MKKFSNKVIVGFFVLVFGILWYVSTRYQIQPERYKIIAYDMFGKESRLEGIRTDFKTQQVASSYVEEYKKIFPDHDFFIGERLLKTRLRLLSKIKI